MRVCSRAIFWLLCLRRTLIWAVPSDCVGRPLTLADVDIVDMAVSPSWDSKSVTSQIMKKSRQIGHSTEYSVIDNAYNLRNACTAAGIAFHRDISHTFFLFGIIFPTMTLIVCLSAVG